MTRYSLDSVKSLTWDIKMPPDFFDSEYIFQQQLLQSLPPSELVIMTQSTVVFKLEMD